MFISREQTVLSELLFTKSMVRTSHSSVEQLAIQDSLQTVSKIMSSPVFTFEKAYSLKLTSSKTTLMVNRMKFTRTLKFGFSKKYIKSK